MSKSNRISFEEEIATQFSNWLALDGWIEQTIIEEGFELGQLSFVFMSDVRLLEFNKTYLNHDFFTDVITFDDVDYKTVNGDILISIERVFDNSKRLEINYLDEFFRVVIHGVLHLCGYKDKTASEVALMREKEDYYLKRRSFT